jgi:hypothetical protein
MKHDPRAQIKPHGPGRNPRGESDPNAHSILRLGANLGRSHAVPAPSPDHPDRPADSARAATSDARLPLGLPKKDVCRWLSISTKTWDRSAAQGLTPAPDYHVGKSPRWLATTIERWLKTRPKLPGRGGKGGQS